MTEKQMTQSNHKEKLDLNIFNMFKAPSREFQKLNEAHSIKHPLIIITVLVLLSTFLLSTIMLDQPFGNSLPVLLITVVFSIISIFFGFLVAALLLWIITKIFGGMIEFKQALSIHILTTIVGILGGFINTMIAVIFNLDVEGQYTGLGALVSQEAPAWALLSIIDLFSIWTGILIAIGIKTVTSFTWTRSIMVVLLTIFIPAVFSYLTDTILAGLPQ